MMDFFTGKLRDLGSKFSHETPKLAAGALAYKEIFLFEFYFMLISHLKLLSIILH